MFGHEQRKPGERFEHRGVQLFFFFSALAFEQKKCNQGK